MTGGALTSHMCVLSSSSLPPPPPASAAGRQNILKVIIPDAFGFPTFRIVDTFRDSSEEVFDYYRFRVKKLKKRNPGIWVSFFLGGALLAGIERKKKIALRKGLGNLRVVLVTAGEGGRKKEEKKLTIVQFDKCGLA